jgi:8-oxo-dGTP pyrophosphatase MutT (NUDIX family)
MQKEIVVRGRAVIIHDDKLLVVKHSHGLDFAALPGGHLEYGESPLECVEREVIEELGIKPVVGDLLYVHSYVTEERQSIEFFFAIDNAIDYLDLHSAHRTHAHEIDEYLWIGRDSSLRVLPEQFMTDFKHNTLPQGTVTHLTRS